MTDEEYYQFQEWKRKQPQPQPQPQTKPTQDEKAIAKPTMAPRSVLDSYSIAVMGVLIGCILWPIGGRFTIDGIVWLCNQLLVFLRAPWHIATPLPWMVYLACIPLPFLCSKVEWHPPLYRIQGKWRLAAADVILVWLFVSGADFITTYFGLRNPASDLPDIFIEVAKSLVVSAILGVVLTFGPEWLLRRSWRRLRG
jgi:hypothetical protein